MKKKKSVPHVNVIICTPGHSVMSGYLRSLLDTIAALSSKNITFAFSNEYASHVANAREATLNGGKENDLYDTRPFKGQVTYDKLFWIDSDITWTPEDFMKLYESDKDIISGAYLLATGEVTAYPKISQKSFSFDEINEMKDVVEIEGAGFGFIAVKSGVFESLSRPWFQTATLIYKDPETDKETIVHITGEDISWCKRVLDNGYKIYLDPTVKLIHTKTVRLTWEGPRP
jgi:hypothetical protein